MKKAIQTMIEEEDIKKLEEEAKARGHTLSSFIRFLVETFLKEQKTLK